MKKIIAAICCLLSINVCYAQKEIPKPYGEVVTKQAVTQRGFFNVHQVGEKIYFEIPDSLLDRDIVIVNRIARSAAETRNNTNGFAGDEIGQSMVRFTMGRKNNLYLVKPMLGERSTTNPTGMFQSLSNSNLQPLIGSYPVKAYGGDSLSKARTYLIDLTEQLNGESELFYFSNGMKGLLGLGSQMQDRSYLQHVNVFPTNIEIRALKTYSKQNSAATYELNSSVVLLPKNLMRPRFYDDRIGFFNSSYTDFDANPQGLKKQMLIMRWRLEPKPEDINRYLNGELVEPRKPIVFFIDPATPKIWIPYFIKGVNAWKSAFEQAGFKNAIKAVIAPTDKSWSIDDAAHNAIVYKASPVLNAMGAEIVDPRTGEIIEAHINWHHNIMKLLHDWYMVQAGGTDPRALKNTFDDDLMGRLIQSVASHEVGHTLGLQHNYAASSSVPVDSLRNNQWIERNGLSPSIMDYARYNYVAQPGDNIAPKNMVSDVGDYDKWAIEWGYRWYPEKITPEKEVTLLNDLTVKALRNKRLRFGAETLDQDPSAQSEDLGDDAAKAGYYGIANLKQIMPKILDYSTRQDKDYAYAKNAYIELLKQYNQYLWHAAKNIGGIYTIAKNAEQEGPVFSYVPLMKQRKMVRFIVENSLKTPTWLIDTLLASKIGMSPVKEIKNSQIMMFARLFAGIPNLIEQGEGSNIYNVQMFFDDIRKATWVGLNTNEDIDIYHRNLQAVYIDAMSGMIKGPKITQNSLQIWMGQQSSDRSIPDLSTVFRAQLTQLLVDINSTVEQSTGMKKDHLQDLSFRIKSMLEGNR